MWPFGSLFRDQEDYWKLRDFVALARNLVDGPMGVNTEMCHLTSRRISYGGDPKATQESSGSHCSQLSQDLKNGSIMIKDGKITYPSEKSFVSARLLSFCPWLMFLNAVDKLLVFNPFLAGVWHSFWLGLTHFLCLVLPFFIAILSVAPISKIQRIPDLSSSGPTWHCLSQKNTFHWQGSTAIRKLAWLYPRSC